MRPFGFYAIACENIFLAYCKKQLHQHFFTVVLRGCKLLASRWWQWSYFYVVSWWANNNNTFFHRIARKGAMTTWYRKEQASAHVVLQGRTTTTSFFTSYCKRSDDRSIFYMSYCKKRRRQAYFLHHIAKRRCRWCDCAKKKLDDTIKRQEVDCICKRLLREALEKLHGQLREASDDRRSQHARRKIALCNDQCRYVVDRRDRSHCCCCIDNNRGGNDRCPSHGASKCYYSKRPACNGNCPRNNQPREQKSSAGREKDSNERTLVRRIARSNDDKGWFQWGMWDRTTQQPIFFIALQGREQLAAIWPQEGQHWLYFLHCITTNEQWQLQFLDWSWGSKQTSSIQLKGINQRMIIPL